MHLRVRELILSVALREITQSEGLARGIHATYFSNHTMNNLGDSAETYVPCKLNNNNETEIS